MADERGRVRDARGRLDQWRPAASFLLADGRLEIRADAGPPRSIEHRLASTSVTELGGPIDPPTFARGGAAASRSG